MLRAAREKGLPITVETAPHYLCFEAGQICDGATEFKCAPPIRDAVNRESLWEGLREGIIDFVASDHSPCLPSLKNLESGDFSGAWGGIASLQWTLPILWTSAQKRGFGLEDVARWTGQNPARFLGLESKKGVIAVGNEADFAVWEPETSFTVNAETNFHRHKVTPYNGVELLGKVRATYLRGDKIFENDVFAPLQGKVIVGNG